FVRDSRKNKYRSKPEELQQVQPAAAGRSTAKVLQAPPIAAASNGHQHLQQQQYYREAQQVNWARVGHAAGAVASTEGCGQPEPTVSVRCMIVDPAANSYAAAAAAMPADCLGQIV
ncbi:hypothetical protein PFISCL1PPCAC_241, partial [Pristionchus fissidentatus]